MVAEVWPSWKVYRMRKDKDQGTDPVEYQRLRREKREPEKES